MTENIAVKAVVLFGSHARGDHTEFSDVDVCIIGPDEDVPIGLNLDTYLQNYDRKRVSVSYYSEDTFERMIEHGSLFLWHLQREGVCVYGENWLKRRLRKLRRYDTHLEDIRLHQEILKDLCSRMQTKWFVNEMDLAVLFTLSRNTCMIVVDSEGEHRFGKLDSYVRAAELHPEFVINESSYFELYNWRSIYDQQPDSTAALPTNQRFNELLGRVKSYLKCAEAFLAEGDNHFQEGRFESIEEVLSKMTQFGYRERVMVEREIFLALKLKLKDESKFNLRGMSGAHRERIKREAENCNWDGSLVRFIDYCFEFHVHVCHMSSSDPYVRAEAGDLGDVRSHAADVLMRVARLKSP